VLIILSLSIDEFIPQIQAKKIAGIKVPNMSKDDMLTMYMLLKATKKKYVPVPVPVFVLPLVLKKIKRKKNEDAEFYLVKPHLEMHDFIRKYIYINGGYNSLYY